MLKLRTLFRLTCQSAGVLILAVLTALVLWSASTTDDGSGTSEATLRQEGARAAERGLSATACPYNGRFGGRRQSLWLRGWSDAKARED